MANMKQNGVVRDTVHKIHVSIWVRLVYLHVSIAVTS